MLVPRFGACLGELRSLLAAEELCAHSQWLRLAYLLFVLCSTVTAAVPVQYYDMPSPSVRSAVWPMMQNGVAPFKVCLTNSWAACRQAVLALSSSCCAVCGRHTVQCILPNAVPA
jgi:hypothetical protein